MKMNQNEKQTLAEFDKFMALHNGAPSRSELKEWVSQYFTPGADSLIRWNPSDWKSNPKFLDKIQDTVFREWASALNNFWINLGRKFKQDVYDNPLLYSFIPVPNPVIVPGGRFLEFYYWDSYWVLRGLLYCEMYEVSLFLKGVLLEVGTYFICSKSSTPNKKFYNGSYISALQLQACCIVAYSEFLQIEE